MKTNKQKVTFITDDMTLYVENPKESRDKLLDLITT